MSDNEYEDEVQKNESFKSMLKKISSVKIPTKPPREIDDDTRDKFFNMIYEIFETPQPFTKDLMDIFSITDSDIEYIAVAIEEGNYDVYHSNDKMYRNKARSIKSNLSTTKNAPMVVERVFMYVKRMNNKDFVFPYVYVTKNKEPINPLKIASMTSQELYPEKIEQIIQKQIEEEDIKKRFQEEKIKRLQNGMLTCGKCKKNTVDFTLVQTRSADEPMTQKCHCVSCGHRWSM